MINNDVIAAVSTPAGVGGIATLRVSGEKSIEICDKVFRSVNDKKLTELKGYHAAFGKIYDKEQPVDEAVCLVFRAPHSFTGENVVEITCHGGIFVIQKVLRVVLENGAKPAQPGEFSKRAFLNGKMDLSGAEGIMSLISSQGEQGLNASLNLLEGSLSRKIDGIAQKLIDICAHISAWVDYPDEEIEELDEKNILRSLEESYGELKALIDKFDSGIAVTTGVEAAIIGKPNAGKSTLMNLLTGYERSIVTDVKGTTRDVVEETVDIDGCILRLSDTAGIRDTDDKVEKLGVERSREKIKRSAIVLAVFDSAEELSDEDKTLIELCGEKPVIPILNKSDKENIIDKDYIEQKLGKCIEMSAKTGSGLDELRDRVTTLLGTKNFDPNAAMLANERQRKCCLDALKSIEEAKSALSQGFTLDAAGVCIDDAVSALLELTGKKASQAVVDKVFSNFCVGK
ncbi:MAG: tRNA uridine-5-carboxymethylaminomethyl(34) synthesis GTPase MnmE [Clostridia bacterium]|nr:tRNA uridine-5-carboxymethylaminomethyl(34) synthesis GTPase MnmE [Clostridia bacterium]